MDDAELKETVKEYWEQEPCGSGFAQCEKYTRQYFDQIEEHRYTVEPFIHQFAQFTRFRLKKVLEIGVGAGTDHVQFARAGAVLSGIDLTEAAIEMVKRRLEIEGLESNLQRADSEHLPFQENTFDLVYSWGVLHHTPDTVRAVQEAYRVCKPGGKICVMLYNRYSLTALQVWILHGLLKLKPFRSLSDVLYHHMESTGTKAYTIREAKRMFKQFQNVKVTPVLTPYDIRRLPGMIGGNMPQAWGWFLVIQAIK